MSEFIPLQLNEPAALAAAYEAAHFAYYVAKRNNDRIAMDMALFDVDRFGVRLRATYR